MRSCDYLRHSVGLLKIVMENARKDFLSHQPAELNKSFGEKAPLECFMKAVGLTVQDGQQFIQCPPVPA